MADLRYPVGEFNPQEVRRSDEQRRHYSDQLALTPVRLREAVRGLTEEQLDTAYRPGGWTVRQVVHHLPDSHMNAYVRVKLALTESRPTIKPYEQQLWAELPDTARAPIAISLNLFDALHERWVILWRSLEPAQFSRKLFHPEAGEMDLDQLLGLYAWHSRHHLAHITSLRQRMGWGGSEK